MNFFKFALLIILVFTTLSDSICQTQIGNSFIGGDFIGRLGSSTDLSKDGSVLAMGSNGDTDAGVGSGKVLIYELEGDQWKIKGDTINGEGFGDSAGRSIALSDDGNTVAIHSPGIGFVSSGLNIGHVRVFTWNGIEWLQLGENIEGMEEDEVLGRGLDLSADGKTLAVGSPSGRETGYVQIYRWINDQWELKGVNAEMVGEETGAMFGFSISLSQNGNMIAIGSVYSEGLGPKTGMVETFRYSSALDSWEQVGQPLIGEAERDAFGWDVVLAESTNTLAIAGPNNDEVNLGAGHIQIYDLNIDDEWEKVGLDIDGEGFGNAMGSSIDISDNGQRLIAGALQNSDAGNNAGKTYVFDRVNSDEFILSITPILGLEPLDNEGFKVSISGDGSIFTTTSPSHDGAEPASGMVRAYRHPIDLSSTNEIELAFSIFPNPTSSLFQVSNPEVHIEAIYNYKGQEILKLKNEVSQVDLSRFTTGLYFVKLRLKDEEYFYKVLKK